MAFVRAFSPAGKKMKAMALPPQEIGKDPMPSIFSTAEGDRRIREPQGGAKRPGG